MTEFWVIFDTCSKPDYYLDVHNLIALPQGWILRYGYRRQLLTGRAEEVIFGSAQQPSLALLVYAQTASFHRGDEPPEDEIPPDMHYVATRMAHLALIPTPDGERAYFDIVVDGYPTPNGDALDTIIGRLAQEDSVPYKKWVAISSQLDAYHSLSQQSRDSNWEQIVEALATPPIQFIGDIFWRLGAPNSGVSPTAEPLSGEDEVVYQFESRYKLNEGRDFVIPVVSHTPPGMTGDDEERRFANLSTNSTRLEVMGSGQIELRRYSQGTARIRAIQTDQGGKTSETVSFGTAPPREKWPPGPSFDLHFDVSKSYLRVIVGIVLITVGVALGVAASASSGKALWVFAGLGALSVILGVLAWTGKLAVP